MQRLRNISRASLLAFTMLSACAVANSPAIAGSVPPGHFTPTGVFGDFLCGEFAMAHGQPNVAAEEFLKALAVSPNNPVLVQKAFYAAAISGRPEAVELARQLPGNRLAQLVLGDAAARTGDWQAAEQRFRMLPQSGLTQLLRPLLVAWAQQGAGQTDAALHTLQPYVKGQWFRGIFALHAAMIADLGGQLHQAASFYHIAQTNSPMLNLRLAQILASWQARSGDPAQARHTLADLGKAVPGLAIAIPGLIRTDAQRSVTSATGGMAEAYLALAGALRAEGSNPFAMMMLRLAMDLSPESTPARLLAAEIMGDAGDAPAALQMLASVPRDDALFPLVRLRRALLNQQMGHPQKALRTLRQLAATYHDPVPLIVEGDVLRSERRFQEAIPVYTSAIAELSRLGRADWSVFYSRGIAYDSIHDWPEAEADFRHALRLSPNQPAVLNYLGYSLADMGKDLPEARRMIAKALQQRPNNSAITDSLGWVMLRQGQINDAVATLQRAVELAPEDPTINTHLGDAYWAAGRKLEAQYQWRRALTLNPTPGDAAKLEAKLRLPQKAAVVSGQ